MTLRANAGALCAGALLAACAHRAPPRTRFVADLPIDIPSMRPRAFAPPAFTFPDLPPVPTEAPDAQPEIVDVIVSSNVASVELRVATFSRAMEKVAPGRFSITMTVPRLPFFLRNRSYAIAVIARNTLGDAVQRTVWLLVR